LIAYKCVEFGVPRKPKDIIAAMDIRDHQLSQGNKILKKFLKTGSLELVDGHGEYTDFVDQYFEKLNIEKYNKYKPFIIDLINATNINKIKTANNSARPTTRITGSVYILCESLKIPNVTRDDIAKKCNISKSTFMRYVDLVVSNKNKKCVKEVFKKYKLEINK
jgi:transcription initiation factor TFIIIB Brf1 subunit/transcription initiation factor TFIIB